VAVALFFCKVLEKEAIKDEFKALQSEIPIEEYSSEKIRGL
jgi:hypothetical protein